METKLVDIMEDLDIDQNKSIVLEKEIEEGSLTLVKTKEQPKILETLQENKLPNWKVSMYDLGGHSPYINSQKMFASNSSFFFLVFNR